MKVHCENCNAVVGIRDIENWVCPFCMSPNSTFIPPKEAEIVGDYEEEKKEETEPVNHDPQTEFYIQDGFKEIE